MKNAIVHALTLAVTVSIVNVIIHQIRKGEPRLVQSVISGVAVGIGVAAFRYWKNGAKTKSDDTRTQ